MFLEFQDGIYARVVGNSFQFSKSNNAMHGINKNCGKEYEIRIFLISQRRRIDEASLVNQRRSTQCNKEIAVENKIDKSPE